MSMSISSFQSKAGTSVYRPQTQFSQQLPPRPFLRGLLDQSVGRAQPVDLDKVYISPGYVREFQPQDNSFEMALDRTAQEILHNKLKMLFQHTGQLPSSLLISEHLSDQERATIFFGYNEFSYDDLVWLSQHSLYPLSDERFSNLKALNLKEFKGDVNEFAAMMTGGRNTAQITKIYVGPAFTEDCFNILLGVCPNLKSIDFSLWNSVNDSHIMSIAQRYPNLEQLYLAESASITGEALKVIDAYYFEQPSCSLKYLTLHIDRMEPEHIRYFNAKAHSRNVTVINVRLASDPFYKNDAWVYAGNLI